MKAETMDYIKDEESDNFFKDNPELLEMIKQLVAFNLPKMQRALSDKRIKHVKVMRTPPQRRR